MTLDSAAACSSVATAIVRRPSVVTGGPSSRRLMVSRLQMNWPLRTGGRPPLGWRLRGPHPSDQPRKVGWLQLRPPGQRIWEFSVLKIGFLQLGIHEECFLHLNVHEERPLQPGTLQVCSSQVSVVEIGAAKIGVGQVQSCYFADRWLAAVNARSPGPRVHWIVTSAVASPIRLAKERKGLTPADRRRRSRRHGPRPSRRPGRRDQGQHLYLTGPRPGAPSLRPGVVAEIERWGQLAPRADSQPG
jgi:hypothetical protein